MNLAICRKNTNQDDQVMVNEQAVFVERTYRRYFPATVKGYVFDSDYAIPTSYVPTQSPNVFDDAMAQKPDDGFIPTHWLVWGGFASGLCGRAILGGDRGFVFLTCRDGTFNHEGGHELGLGHADMVLEDVVRPYLDQTSLMGKKPRVNGFNAVNYIDLGIEATPAVEGENLLGCLETSPIARHPNEAQILHLGNVYLSRRKIKGFPACVGSNYQNTVFAHWKGPGGSSQTGDKNIELGETVEIEGFHVEHVWNNPNHAMLRIGRV